MESLTRKCERNVLLTPALNNYLTEGSYEAPCPLASVVADDGVEYYAVSAGYMSMCA